MEFRVTREINSNFNQIYIFDVIVMYLTMSILQINPNFKRIYQI